ncbi:MAG: 4Fe-4S binding protein [Spirochaetales bacterium]|nr:4Fe-4S binding protein [Spirochaetales bacterium]
MKSDKVNVKGIIVNLFFTLVFWTLAIALFAMNPEKNIFFLINFGYIGLAFGLGMTLYQILPRKKKALGRKLTQFMVGIYLFVFLGIVARQNIQIEGFWFEILYGVMTAPLMHYLIAKILGTPVIGRIYCGWACWTAMVLDVLPFKRNNGRIPKLGRLRYIHFFLSLAFVLVAWFTLGYNHFSYFQSRTPGQIAYNSQISLLWFLAGNVIYYAAAIIMAFVLRDNRAFCKYLCPITVFLKLGSPFSLIKIKGESKKCTSCGTCEKVCPMDIQVSRYIKEGKRVLSSDCTLCQSCKDSCPEKILKLSFAFDAGFKNKINYRL